MTLLSTPGLVPTVLVRLLPRLLSGLLLNLLPSLALAAPGASQDVDVDPPFLELRSSHHSLAWHVAHALAGEAFSDLDFPDFEETKQLRVVYGADEQVHVQAVPQGEYDLELRIRKRPEVLGKIFEECLGPARRILHMTVFMTLTAKMQMEGRHAAQAMQSVMRFHHQLEDLHLRVKKGEESDASYGIDLWVQPKQGTWLHEVVHGLEASKKGAPHLRSPHATLTVTAAARGKGLTRFLEPFANHLGLFRGHDREERERFMQLARGRLQHFDGCFGLMIDGPGRYVRMIGLESPEDYRKLAARKVVQAFDCRRPGRIDVVVAADEEMPRTLAGSGIQLLLKETDPLAFTEEEAEQSRSNGTARGMAKGSANGSSARLATFAGVVGDFSVKARLPEGGEEMARLVARIREQRLRRMPILEGALLRAQVRLQGLRVVRHPDKELEEALKPLQDMLGETLRQVPESVDVSLYRCEDRLHLRLDTR